MANIHPTAVVDPQADLAEEVEVGPLCYVGPQVVIGPGTRLVSHVVVLGLTILGRDNTVWPNVVLGGDPQDLKYKSGPTQLIIGDANDIRESVTIHKGTENDQGVTRVGNHNLVMAYVHIAHDCVIGDRVVLANSVALAGHVVVEDHAAVGGQSGVHHFVTIGQYGYVGGMTRIVQDTPPFMVVEGNPAKVRQPNLIGLARHGFSNENIDHLKDAYRRLFRNSANGEGVGQTAEMLVQLEQDYADDEHIISLIQFMRNTTNGMHGRYRETLRHDNRRKAVSK